MEKKIILIDLDDTLLDFHRAKEESLIEVFKKYNVEISKENIDAFSKINKEYWRKLERKEVSRDYLLSARFVDFFKTINRDVDGSKVNDYYFSILSTCGYYLNNAETFVKKAKELGFTLLLVSNGVGYVQKGRLLKTGLDKYLDHIYLSEEMGFSKPDVHFFDKLFEQYKIKENMILVGDSLTSDIQGGINFGVTTVWFNPNHEEGFIKPDYEIDDLLKLFDIIKEYE